MGVAQVPRGNTWREHISRRLDALGRWTTGRLVTDIDSDVTAIPCGDFLEPEVLRIAIERAAGRDTSEDERLRLGVSRFTRHYAAAVSSAALVGLADGIGLDVSLQRAKLSYRGNVPFAVVLDLADDDVVSCIERPTPLFVPGPTAETIAELRMFVWQKAYAENIVRVFERLGATIKALTGVVWTNAAEWSAIISDAAEEHLEPAQARPYVEDRQALLGTGTLPGVHGPSPLRGRINWLTVDDLARGGRPLAVHVREVCCRTYLLPDRDGRLCGSCPSLPIEDRLALVRERHRVATGGPEGPATGRARVIGRRRMATRRGQPR